MAENESIDILADRVERLACSNCGHHIDLSDAEPFSSIECPQCSARQVVPMRLGSFLLVAEMGKGGMGRVYRAYDETLGRYVAIKVMQKKLAADQKFADNFIREARAAAALNHPNVVQIYSCGQENGQLYIVMELVDGGRLDEMMKGDQPLDEIFVLDVGIQVARGLQAANEIGLIHGDIKPANILFDKQRRAKVVDFGLARFAAKQHLQPGEIWGTPYYIAPEKARGQNEDLRADIYSLGATLYHVLAGTPPFDGDTAKDVVLARLNAPAPDLRALLPSLQPETADVIARTLEQDPSRRYPTYHSLLPDMEEALRVSRQRHGMPSVSDKKRSRVPILIGTAVVLVVALSYLFWGGPQETDLPALDDQQTMDIDPDEREKVPEEDPDPETIYAVQPFDAEAAEQVQLAVEAWADERVNEHEEMFSALFSSMPRVGVERVWAGVLQALPAWEENRMDDVRGHLRGIEDATLRELKDDTPHPGAMPQSLSHYMLGRIDQQQLEEIGAEWPQWFADLSRFVTGLQALRRGDMDDAADRLTRYLESAAEDVQWPYASQAVADDRMEKLAAWQEVSRRVAEAEPDDAVEELSAYRRTADPAFHEAIDAELSRVEALKQQAEEQLRKTEQRRRDALVEEDREKVREAVKESRPLVEERNFRRAGELLRQNVGHLETERGRAFRDTAIERYLRLEALKRFLIESIREAPASRELSPELTGDVINANSRRIQMALGEHGSIDVDWDRVSGRLLATLTEHYMADLSDEQQADMLLSLAIFAYESGSPRAAISYIGEAVEKDSDIQDAARELLPDLDLD